MTRTALEFKVNTKRGCFFDSTYHHIVITFSMGKAPRYHRRKPQFRPPPRPKNTCIVFQGFSRVSLSQRRSKTHNIWHIVVAHWLWLPMIGGHFIHVCAICMNGDRVDRNRIVIFTFPGTLSEIRRQLLLKTRIVRSFPAHNENRVK